MDVTALQQRRSCPGKIHGDARVQRSDIGEAGLPRAEYHSFEVGECFRVIGLVMLAMYPAAVGRKIGQDSIDAIHAGSGHQADEILRAVHRLGHPLRGYAMKNRETRLERVSRASGYQLIGCQQGAT